MAASLELLLCRIFNINFKAMINVSQVLAQKMIHEKVEGGTIVNISSIVSRTDK